MTVTAAEIDVIINCHNYGRFLTDAVDSARLQQGVSVNVIVVDDGSTDETPEVVAALGDAIRSIRTENRGQGAALNTGFAISNAPLVMFLDADDALLPGALARAVAGLDGIPGAVKAQWAMVMTGADLTPSGAVVPAAHVPMPSGDVRAAERRYGFDLSWAATSGNLFPRSTLEALLPIPESHFPIGADWYLQHLSALLGPVVSLREPGTLRRVHGQNAYEQSADAAIDLRHIRRSIVWTERTTRAMRAFLAARGDHSYKGPRAVSSAADRTISLRLDRRRHPIAGDGRLRVLRDGLRAAVGRDDCAPVMRVAFAGWFCAMAVVPRPLARTLARWWLFPEQRRGLNRLLGRLHRHRPEGR